MCDIRLFKSVFMDYQAAYEKRLKTDLEIDTEKGGV